MGAETSEFDAGRPPARSIPTAAVTAVIHCWAKNVSPYEWDRPSAAERAGWQSTCWYLFIHFKPLQLGLGLVQLLFIFQTVNGGYYLWFLNFFKYN